MKQLNTYEDLFTKDGRLNTAILRQNWFKESSLYKKILENSAFVDKDATMLLRVHVAKFNLTSIPKCAICESAAHFNPYATMFGEFLSTCNNRSCIAKSTVDKRNTTLISKYGAKVSLNHVSKNKEAVETFVEKAKVSIKKKYGVNNASQIPGVNEKKKQTLLKNHGVIHPAHIKTNQQKSREKSISFFQSLCDSVIVHDLKDPLVANKIISFNCLKCNTEESLPTETYKWRIKKLNTPCTKCSEVNIGSTFQKEILLFLQSIYDGDIVSNDKQTLNGLELDILIPDLHVAIEANGVFWHSTQSGEEDLIYKNYHVNKTNMCESAGIKLIHIFEDDWIFKTDTIKGRLKSLISPEKIYARKCSIVFPSTSEQKTFFNDNHIQGHINSSFCVGLQYDNCLVAIMSFGKPRFSKKHEWELLRFCSKGGYTVIGAASKMFKQFTSTYPNTTVISYADRTWGPGNVYSKLGFKCDGVSQPSYRWSKNLKSLSRYQTQKYRLSKVISNFNKNLSESQNMFANGWRRIWDCGTTKWVYSSI